MAKRETVSGRAEVLSQVYPREAFDLVSDVLEHTGYDEPEALVRLIIRLSAPMKPIDREDSFQAILEELFKRSRTFDEACAAYRTMVTEKIDPDDVVWIKTKHKDEEEADDQTLSAKSPQVNSELPGLNYQQIAEQLAAILEDENTPEELRNGLDEAVIDFVNKYDGCHSGVEVARDQLARACVKAATA
jgi:hypothetical protein